MTIPIIEQMRARFEDAVTAMTFLMAGKAIVTLRSQRTGDSYTYKVSEAPKRNPSDEPSYFVALLTGADNENDYTYIGMVKNNRFFTTAKSKMKIDSPPCKALIYALNGLAKGSIPSGLEIWHEERCARCGRKLTVPGSVATGLGPECALILGVGQVQLPVTKQPARPLPTEQPARPLPTPVLKNGELMREVASVKSGLSPAEVEQRIAHLRTQMPHKYASPFHIDGVPDEPLSDPQARDFWTKRFTYDSSEVKA